MSTNVILETIPVNITVTILLAAIAVRVKQATNCRPTRENVKVRNTFSFLSETNKDLIFFLFACRFLFKLSGELYNRPPQSDFPTALRRGDECDAIAGRGINKA